MNETNRTLSPEELVQLQKKFSEIKHSINNALAVMMALSEMSQRRPDYAEKLATTVLSKAPQIVSGLQEFTQLLNEKAGAKPAVADDYVTKPFSPREIVLRIKAILRRGATEEADDRLSAGPITIDPARHEVLVNGKRVELTSLEFKLLRTLMQRRGRVQERDRLLNEVWGYESVIDTRTVDTHVRRLREKLGKAGEVVETVRGFGYRVRDK